MELLFLLLLILIFLRLLFRSSANYKGYTGERKVVGKLGKLINAIEGCKAFHNVTLATPDGTTQIDHILLVPQGIFVIETKNMTGWIFGGEWQKRWTQTIYDRKVNFQNPIHQNYKHVKALESLLGIDPKIIFNVVVFVGDSEFKTPMPDNVVELRGLLPYINSHADHVLTGKEMGKLASFIEQAISNNVVSDKEHVHNVKRNRENPVCPRCGSSMVSRTVKNGKNKGSHFWGCSSFPSCKATKKMG